jgi:hypothetical protein
VNWRIIRCDPDLLILELWRFRRLRISQARSDYKDHRLRPVSHSATGVDPHDLEAYDAEQP